MPTEISEPEWVSYELAGAALPDVAAAISALDEAGWVEWFPRYEYETEGGVVSTVSVVVAQRVTMPEWDSYASAGPPAQREWERFLAALSTHEQGHLELVQHYLCTIDEQMVGHSASQAEQVWTDALNALQAASDAYDQQTDHGRNEGTLIDLDVDAEVTAAE